MALCQRNRLVDRYPPARMRHSASYLELRQNYRKSIPKHWIVKLLSYVATRLSNLSSERVMYRPNTRTNSTLGKNVASVASPVTSRYDGLTFTAGPYWVADADIDHRRIRVDPHTPAKARRTHSSPVLRAIPGKFAYESPPAALSCRQNGPKRNKDLASGRCWCFGYSPNSGEDIAALAPG